MGQASAPSPLAKAGRDRPLKGWKRRAEALKRATKGAVACARGGRRAGSRQGAGRTRSEHPTSE